MLDSVRVRLTLWYTAVVAVVLILLAVLTYFLYARNIAQRTDSNLVELADSFATTFHAELSDEISPDAPQKAAREAMVEHRFRDVVFVFQDSEGNPLLSSLDLPSAVLSNQHLTPGLFASRDFQTVASLAGSPHPFRTIHGGKGGYRAYARPLSAAGRTFILVVLQSLHPQRELLERHSQFLPLDHSHRASTCSTWRLFPRTQESRSRGLNGLQGTHHRRRESPRSSWRIESTRRTRPARHLLQ